MDDPCRGLIDSQQCDLFTNRIIFFSVLYSQWDIKTIPILSAFFKNKLTKILYLGDLI